MMSGAPRTSHKVAVLLSHVDSELSAPERELITIARGFGAAIAVSFAAPSPAVAQDLAALGISELVIVNADADWHLTPVAAEGLVLAVRETKSDTVLVPTTFENREIAALAARDLQAGLIADAQPEVTADGQLIGFKRVFAGTWDVRAAFTTDIAVMTVRANTVQASEVAPVDYSTSTIELVASPWAKSATLHERVQHERSGANRPPLAEAAYVVAGGRGTLGDFSAVEELADALGAAVGATRDAVDEGWVNHDAQIGQTGVTVAPRVYIGAGISGAPHHRGGMQAAQTIIAVNTDPETPLFEICDFAVVGDLSVVLPQASEALREYFATKQR